MGDCRIYESSEPSEDSPITMNHPSPTVIQPNCSAYTIPEQPLGTPKPLRILIIGAGISGLNLLRTLRHNLPANSYKAHIYDKNSEVGGTWHENRYPGCRCDIPSHCYQYSWRPNKEWTNFFAPAAEIGAYLHDVCEQEGLGAEVSLGHEVMAARWAEDEGLWHVRVKEKQSGRVFEDEGNFLINASGVLNNWKWPEVEGISDFQGTLIHTAAWPEDFDYTNKTVAVIGNGASGLQVLPVIQPDSKKLYHIVRSPTWIPPPWRQAQTQSGGGQMLKEITIDEQENFSPEQINKFQEDEDFYRRFVKGIEKDSSGNFRLMIKDSPLQHLATQQVRAYMAHLLDNDPRLCSLLIPTFPLGTRRLTPAPGYLEAVRQPNVEVVGGNMARFVADGIVMESGEVLKVDAIICATGFDVSFIPRFALVGRDGVDLREKWRISKPEAYMSVAVEGMPNYFTFLGPNGPIGHGSVFTLSEHIARYITRLIRKAQEEHIHALAPRRDAVRDYNAHIAAFMPRTTWAAPGARSWFQRDGEVVALHPGSRVHFFHMLQTVRSEDYEFSYGNGTNNRFGYLGNGFSTKEGEQGGDSSWYLDEGTVV